MEIRDFLLTINIKPTKELLANTKLATIVDYINANDINVTINEEYINPQSFSRFLEEIRSVKTAVSILNASNAAFIINFYGKEIASWYNLYNPEKFRWINSDYSQVLLSNEYLKVAPIEWTETVFKKFDKIVTVGKDGRVIVRNNVHSEDEEGYIDPIYMNMMALSVAKDKGLIGKVVNRISKESI